MKVTRRNLIEAGSAVLAMAGADLASGQAPDKTSTTEKPLTSTAAGPLFVSFTAGQTGVWRIDRVSSVVGESLSVAPRLDVLESHDVVSRATGEWVLRGVTSNVRYSSQAEVAQMRAKQEGLGRPRATRAALIPIRKTAAWWALAQDQRRALFEEQSHHIAIGEDYLPKVARRLHHSRELAEPFDFLTWFEYAPEDGESFEQLVRRLRATREWTYVDREVDIRLSRT